jgi:lipid-binding SYLF domain-containing protein
MIAQNNRLVALLTGLAFTLMAPLAVSADTKAEALVNDALASFNNFVDDPGTENFASNLKAARAVLIVPTYTRAGFIVGGSGGAGVVVAKSPEGEWMGPAFYTMGAGSFGFQAGIDQVEVLLLIMTQKGFDSLLSTNVKLGTGVSVSAATAGGGAGVATSDVISYSRTKGGLFAGFNVEGSVVNPNEDRNIAFYGPDGGRPADILVRGSVSNPAGEPLVEAVAEAAD